MRGLKILVTVLTLLIFASMALLAYGIATKLSGGKTGAAEAAIALPANSKILSVTGAKNQATLHLQQGKDAYIYVVDTRDGSIQSRLRITDETPRPATTKP